MATDQQEIEFNDLLKRNQQTINNICIRYCGGDAFYFNELRQECAMAIWAEYSRYRLSRFRGLSSESTWIYQISYHAVADYLRNPHRQEFQHLCDHYEHQHLADKSSTDDWLLFDECTAHLNNRERILLDLYLEGDTYSTISRTLDITESTARKRMSRLLNKLKMLINK